jgi:hypothetical protein
MIRDESYFDIAFSVESRNTSSKGLYRILVFGTPHKRVIRKEGEEAEGEGYLYVPRK